MVVNSSDQKNKNSLNLSQEYFDDFKMEIKKANIVSIISLIAGALALLVTIIALIIMFLDRYKLRELHQSLTQNY